jgi:hypothetical protein
VHVFTQPGPEADLDRIEIPQRSEVMLYGPPG